MDDNTLLLGNTYIEITNPVHGGDGWELGECLWSPTKSKNNRDVWRQMIEVQPGDKIIHSLKLKGGHHFYGISIAMTNASIHYEGPPIPGEWAGYESYYKIFLQDFSKFEKEVSVKEFFAANEKSIERFKKTGSFITSENKMAQKYIAPIPPLLFEIIENYLTDKGIKLFSNIQIKTDIDKSFYGLDEKPGRTIQTTSRIIRNTKIIRELKNTYNNTCQICGIKIQSNTGYYSEGHHIRPLGGVHGGYDHKSNVIILCPNHHIEFDYGVVAIDPESKMVVYKRKSPHEMAYQRVDISEDSIKYHFDNIYNVK